MKRLFLIAFLASLLLSGCADPDSEKLQQFSRELSQARSLQAVADVQLRYPEGTVEYRLQFKQSGDKTELGLLAPEALEGMVIELSEDGSLLHYDELHLETGALDGDLSPLSALPLLAESLKDAYAGSFSRSGGLWCVSLQPEDGILIDAFFEEDMQPCRAEFWCGDVLQMVCQIENWHME